MELKGSADNLQMELDLSQKIIGALTNSYQDVYYVNIRSGEMRCYRSSRAIREQFGSLFEGGDFEANFYNYIRNAVHKDDQHLFEPVLTVAEVRKTFARQMTYGFGYRAVRDGEVHYCQADIVRIPDSRDEYVFAFKNVDKQHQLEESLYEKDRKTVKAMAQQINEVARGPILNIIEKSKAAKERAQQMGEDTECFDSILKDGHTLLMVVDSIFAAENTDRNKVVDSIMHLGSLRDE